jgi:hypothetical protein
MLHIVLETASKKISLYTKTDVKEMLSHLNNKHKKNLTKHQKEAVWA